MNPFILSAGVLLMGLAAEPSAWDPAAVSREALSSISAFTQSVQRVRSRVPDKIFAQDLSDLAQNLELRRCPAQSSAIGGPPDPMLYTQMGFRYFRRDGTTCAAQPSGQYRYFDQASRGLSFAAGDPAAFSYELSVPEYMIVRHFYFGTDWDATRSFYHYDERRGTGRSIPELVTLDFPNRADYPIFPWEGAESFQLTYGRPEGAQLVSTGGHFEYAIRSQTGKDEGGRLITRFTVDIQKRSRLNTPESGAVGLKLEKRGGRLFLNVSDTRAEYYAAEKLGLKIRVWRSQWLFGKTVVYDMDITLTPASQNLIDLSDSKWAPYRKDDLLSNRDYYVVWSFRRADSKISTGDWIDRGQTDSFYLP